MGEIEGSNLSRSTFFNMGVSDSIDKKMIIEIADQTHMPHPMDRSPPGPPSSHQDVTEPQDGCVLET